MGVRLAHVCFESDDLDKTEAFYNILGIERRFEFRNLQDELVGYYLAFDNQTFIEVIKTARLAKPGLIRHFAIEVDNVDDVYDALKSNGIDAGKKTASWKRPASFSTFPRSLARRRVTPSPSG